MKGYIVRKFGVLGLVAAAAMVPTPVLADPPTVIVTQCGESTCYVLECQSYPMGDDWSANGCAVIYSYPRPREVSGD